MADKDGSSFLQIDTEDLELSLSEPQLRKFRKNRAKFADLVNRLIVELGLQGLIEHLTVCSPAQCRAVLYREIGNPWPSKRVCLDIYIDRYMNERLLRHEFQHEADRRNPEMLYDPAIEERWRNKLWALEAAANISVDARLGKRGLGKEFRRKEFRQAVRGQHDALFEDTWANPPRTWSEMEAVAFKLVEFGDEEHPKQCPVAIRPKRHTRVRRGEE